MPWVTYAHETVIPRQSNAGEPPTAGVAIDLVDGVQKSQSLSWDAPLSSVSSAVTFLCDDWHRTQSGLKPYAVEAHPPRKPGIVKRLSDVRIVTLYCSRSVRDIEHKALRESRGQQDYEGQFAPSDFRLRIVRCQRIEDIPQDDIHEAAPVQSRGIGAPFAAEIFEPPSATNALMLRVTEQTTLEGYRIRISAKTPSQVTPFGQLPPGEWRPALDIEVSYGDGAQPRPVATDMTANASGKITLVVVVSTLGAIGFTVFPGLRVVDVLKRLSLDFVQVGRGQVPAMGLPLLRGSAHKRDIIGPKAKYLRVTQITPERVEMRPLMRSQSASSSERRTVLYARDSAVAIRFAKGPPLDVWGKLAIDLGIGLVPILGDVIDLVDLVLMMSTGKDKWGDEATQADIAIQAVALLLPLVSRRALTAAAPASDQAKEIAAQLARDARVRSVVGERLSDGAANLPAAAVRNAGRAETLKAVGSSGVPHSVAASRDVLRVLQ